MDINFDEKEGKPSTQSDINKLKRDLNAENFRSIYKLDNSSSDKKKDNDNKVMDQKNNNIEEEKEKNINHSDNEILISKDINIKNIVNTSSPNNKESQKEEINQSKEDLNINNNEENNKDEEEKEKEVDLIPLWYKCLNREHSTKYISLDRRKENLICKYCFQMGALETNLELNQEFIDEYNKNLEAKKNISEISKDIIKETSEENISDKEDSTHKLEEEGENNDLNLSNNIIKNEIKCLTFDCHNYPYYICETCKDFICYKCIMEKLEERTDKIKHNFHDIDSVNYEANTFRDDVKINLETLKDNINSCLEFLEENEKDRINNLKNKMNNEDKIQLIEYHKKSIENIKLKIMEKNKLLFDKFCGNIYGNIDNEVKDLNISNNNIKNNVQQILDELKLIKEKINNKETSYEDVCDLHNKYIELLKKAKLLIQRGNSILFQTQNTLHYLNSRDIKNMYEKEELTQTKILSDNQKSFIQSLSNNYKKSGSYNLNRFVSYKHFGLKYVGFSTLEFSCSKDIILYGVILCGKYLSSKKIKQNDYSEIDMNVRNYYKINIKVYELSCNKVLINENKNLYEIINVNDPVVNIFFEKGLKINKDEKYIIVVENLENEKYLDLWMGNIYKKTILDNKQVIKCNMTGIEFRFGTSHEYNSDLDEFKQGIIEGISYGN